MSSRIARGRVKPPSLALTSDHRRILDYLHRFGGLSEERAHREGWCVNGQPRGPLLELQKAELVAPRVFTSYPLSVVWQITERAYLRETNWQLTAMAEREKLREYAPGGLFVDLERARNPWAHVGRG